MGGRARWILAKAGEKEESEGKLGAWGTRKGGGAGRRIVVVVAVGAGTGSDAGTEEAVRQHVRGG
jgi:hypothetical protein